jgi:plastocyanin
MPKVQRSRTFTAAALAAVAALALGSAVVLAATTQVTITESNGRYAFGPGKVTINVGDTVTWQNNSDAPHTADSDDGSTFDGEIAAETGSFSHTFDAAGTFAYSCDIHDYMKGSVVVEEAGGGGGGGEPSQPPTDTIVPAGTGGDGQAPLPLVFALLALALGVALLAARRFATVREDRD